MSMDTRELVAGVEQWVTAARRALHSMPEPGFREFETAAFIAESLKECGYNPQTEIAETGVVARLETGRPGPVILLRADMDGLGMAEATGLPYASKNMGMAHGCGHDCHCAMLLGAARVLNQIRDCLKGEIRFVFQPAEEDPGGAEPMIQAGVMDDPEVDYCFGLHVWPGLPAGTLGVKSGNLMASPTFFYITVRGKGGHGAMPHECVDALEIGTQVVSALQRIVSRQADPLEPTVVSVGSFHAGTVENVIPEKAEIAGTIRTFSSEWASSWQERLERIVGGVCRSMGADCSVSLSGSYPPLKNDPDAASIVREAAIRCGSFSAIVEPDPVMTGEDFSFYLQKAKGAFAFLGTGYDGGDPLHSPGFTIPEAELSRGVSLFVQTVVDLSGDDNPAKDMHDKN